MYKMINSMLFNAKSYVPAPRRKPIPCAVELDLEGGVAVGQDAAVRKYQVRLEGPRPVAPGGSRLARRRPPGSRRASGDSTDTIDAATRFEG